jgi:hypothetical protein
MDTVHWETLILILLILLLTRLLILLLQRFVTCSTRHLSTTLVIMQAWEHQGYERC